jgi:hypothetical protein
MTDSNTKNDAALIPGKAALQAVDLINSKTRCRWQIQRVDLPGRQQITMSMNIDCFY